MLWDILFSTRQSGGNNPSPQAVHYATHAVKVAGGPSWKAEKAGYAKAYSAGSADEDDNADDNAEDGDTEDDTQEDGAVHDDDADEDDDANETADADRSDDGKKLTVTTLQL
jgi:hypothetical protein